MGFPFFGETLQMVLQRSKFLQMKRRKYGFIYKTHLFGRPTVRVMGADNVRRILLGEHRLVSVQWPASVRTILGSGCLSNLHDSLHKQRKKVIMRAFSREALQCYVPVIAEEVGSCLEQWLSCGESGLLVYPQVKRLMFRIAMRILMGCESRLASGGEAEQQLVEAFEEMTRNLFSLPIDVPFSGLYRGLKARNLIHARIEENIRAKICGLRAAEADGGYKDALQLLIEHSWERGERLDMQALKQSSTELLFGGHETTASAATSLITYLGLYPHVLQKLREELKSKGLLCKGNQDNKLDMEILEQLKYTGCVIKETLRLNPPVPGGFRVALKTFELNLITPPRISVIFFLLKVEFQFVSPLDFIIFCRDTRFPRAGMLSTVSVILTMLPISSPTRRNSILTAFCCLTRRMHPGSASFHLEEALGAA
ncbi:cytochrome P450 26A1 isoform X2 [Globicephala melas]|uniref:cytochrome P450 26A1 isoform X2 n=1 Tax=Globicephala melas TaxID=9731 RepID=UPI00293D2A8B|nr:cytochrome P450 26A1 isoform X2 [Globicephala melas]